MRRVHTETTNGFKAIWTPIFLGKGHLAHKDAVPSEMKSNTCQVKGRGKGVGCYLQPMRMAVAMVATVFGASLRFNMCPDIWFKLSTAYLNMKGTNTLVSWRMGGKGGRGEGEGEKKQRNRVSERWSELRKHADEL